ncbi:hypothetical protein [Streptomyces sp. NBC_01775]|uniref:hypothetical protein n=1 Tax=Streptomyces sp. NBC_01775 TaxID=2975939 RepID=UPI003FA37FD6
MLTSEKMRLSIISAFETAALDAYGREPGVPVHALLGGKVRDRVDYAGYQFYKWGRHPGAEDPADDWDEALDPEGVVAWHGSSTSVAGRAPSSPRAGRSLLSRRSPHSTSTPSRHCWPTTT